MAPRTVDASRLTARVARLALVGAAALALSGCRAFPNMDGAGSGCANRGGAGPRDSPDDPPGIPLDGIAGRRPADAAAAAKAMGHVVVFRLDDMSCVCVPPTGYGPVQEGWWGGNGQLYLDLQDVTPQGQKVPDGTGC